MVTPLHLGTLVLMLIFYRQVQPVYIYGGKEAVPHSRPYMVFLNRTSGNISKSCDGFLVREDFVITAAHCSNGDIKVVLGVHNVVNKSGQEILVKTKFPHPNFSNMDNDIMLLKLEKNASLNNKVKLIDLPQTNDAKVPKNCLVSGWGFYKRNEHIGSKLLQEVNITTDDNKWCSDHHEICSSGSNGPAEGDSGGPLVCNGTAYGVVSSYVHYKNITTYIYVRIPDFLDWITETMKF